MNGYEDYYENTSPFDEEMERIKDHLREGVAKEIKKELEDLRAQNNDMAARLANLGTLERAAEDARRGYEQKLHNAKVVARNEVQKEGLRKLLELLREARYRVCVVWDTLPKCGKCDEERRLHYTTPRGKETYEMCECAEKTQRWDVEEMLVHEVARRSSGLLTWWHPTSRYSDDDYVGSPTVLQSPDGHSIEQMMEHPREYGFPTEEAAAVLAAALNQKDES